MSYQKDIFDLITRLSGSGNILAVPRMFCEMTGSLESGVLLSQIIYWADKGSDPDGWFYKSYIEWYQDSFLSEYQVRKGVRAFEKAGLLETKLKKVQGSPTLHYRVNKRVFSEWILKNLGFETVKPKDELPNPQCPSIYTETTTEITSIEKGGENLDPPIGNSPAQTTPPLPPAPLATPMIERAEQVAEAESFDGPKTTAPMSRTAKATIIIPASPHYDGRKFKKGLIPAGKGTTAVEVYYEAFAINMSDTRLTEPGEDDLMRECPDLDRLRTVVTAYRRSSYRKGHIQLILDWYNGGVPSHKPGTTYANGTQGVPAKPASTDLTFKQFLLKQYHTDVAAAIIRGTNKTEKELRDEYNQWLTGVGRPTNANHPG